jgi:hypothetical protein
VIQWEGRRAKDIKKSFAAAVARSGIQKRVTPHTLKHTCCSWMLQCATSKFRIDQQAASTAGIKLACSSMVYNCWCLLCGSDRLISYVARRSNLRRRIVRRSDGIQLLFRVRGFGLSPAEGARPNRQLGFHHHEGSR